MQEENNDPLKQLELKLNKLFFEHEKSLFEINKLKKELDYLQNLNKLNQEKLANTPIPSFDSISTKKTEIITSESKTNDIKSAKATIEKEVVIPKPAIKPKSEPENAFNLEKFIGENLISKIGILITIIGVAFGAKYSIDHQLISPATRIAIGYLIGFGLLGFALKFKKKYFQFSAILASGSIAIFYFNTYFAYTLYDLFSQEFTFAFLFLTTLFAVYLSFLYDMIFIAYIALLGAYAIPFLLSNGDHKKVFFLTYISIVNIGILMISLRKGWKSLYYTAYFLSWLITSIYILSAFNYENEKLLASIFIFINFVIFLVILMWYQLKFKEKLEIIELFPLIGNSLIYIGWQCWIINSSENTKDFLGLCLILFSFLHVFIAFLISKLNSYNQELKYIFITLSIAYLTLFIPIQLDGDYLSLFWLIETLTLLYFGRKKNIALFEKLALITLCLSVLIIVVTGFNSSFYIENSKPFLNQSFALNVTYITLLFGILLIIKRVRNNNEAEFSEAKEVIKYLSLIISIILIYISFGNELNRMIDFIFKDEIKTYLQNLRTDNQIQFSLFKVLFNFKTISILIFHMLLLLGVGKFFKKSIQKTNFKEGFFYIYFLSFILCLIVFLKSQHYLWDVFDKVGEYDYNHFESTVLVLRYIYLLFSAYIIREILLYSINHDYKKQFNYFFFLVSVAIISSSELVNLTKIFGGEYHFKIGLSILWATLSIIYIFVGLFRKEFLLRIGGIVMIGITILKLFIYDIRELDGISKTILFIIIGILMLGISYLYNYFKNQVNLKEND